MSLPPQSGWEQLRGVEKGDGIGTEFHEKEQLEPNSQAPGPKRDHGVGRRHHHKDQRLDKTARRGGPFARRRQCSREGRLSQKPPGISGWRPSGRPSGTNSLPLGRTTSRALKRRRRPGTTRGPSLSAGGGMEGRVVSGTPRAFTAMVIVGAITSPAPYIAKTVVTIRPQQGRIQTHWQSPHWLDGRHYS